MVIAGKRKSSAVSASTQELIAFFREADSEMFQREAALRREEQDREDRRREMELNMRREENSAIVSVLTQLVSVLREK